MRREAFVVSSANYRAMRPLNYTPAVEALRNGQGKHGAISLGRAVAELGLGYATVFARIDAAPEHGVELLSQSDMFAAEPAGRWIRRDSMAQPQRHEVRRYQILIAGAGTLGENELYGRPIIADGRLAGKYVGQDTLALSFDPPGSDLNLYTYAFLASRTGVKAVRATSYGTKVLRIRTDLLRGLPIPLADPVRVKRVADCIRKTIDSRELFAQNLSSARAIVSRLHGMAEATALCADRKRRIVVATPPLKSLNAWNFASDGGASDFLGRTSHARIGDFVTAQDVFRGNRYPRVDCEAPYGVEIGSQRDLFLIRPAPRRVVRPEAPDRALFIPHGALAFANAGTLNEGELFGRVMYVSGMFAGMAFSELILRMLAHRAPEFLFAFLSTVVGFRLIRATAFGSKLLYLRPTFLRDIPVPEVGDVELREIADLIQRGFAAKDAAHAAEKTAVRIIDDEVMPRWLA